MHATLKTTCLVVMLVLTAVAVGHGEAQPAIVVVESSHADPSVAARLTVAEVGATIAAGASIGDLLRAVAAQNQDPAVTREVLRAGAPIDGRDTHGWTALMYAAAFNRNPEVVHTLLDAGADLGAGGRYRPVPSEAARHLSARGTEQDAPAVLRSVDVAELFHRLLMEEVAEVLGGVELRGGEPALFMAAAYNEQPSVAQALIDAGSDVNASLEGGVTALMMAAAVNSNPEVVEILLAAGADVNARTVSGETPLLVAAGYSDEDGITALMMAAAVNPNPEVVEVLLAAGADVNARTGTGQTALMDAARNPFAPRSLRALLVAGAEVDAPDDQGRTALVYAVRSSGFDFTEKVTALIETGADVHVRAGDDGATVLMYAAQYNPEATWVLQELMDAGVELDARDNRGWTALMRSAAHGSHSDVVETLLGLGADVSLQNDAGQTALDLMRDNPNLSGTHVYWRLQELMARTTLDITAKEAGDLTVAQVRAAIAGAAPLGRLLCEVACYNRNAAVTQTLLTSGAPTSYRCASGWTALMRAAALNPNPAVVRALLDAGAELEALHPYEPTPIGCVHPNPEYREAMSLVSVLSEQHQTTALRGSEAAFLFAAAYNENPAVLQAFIDAGADVNAYASYEDGGVTPLILAAGLNRNPEMVRTLIAAGADPNAGIEPPYRNEANGPTVLMAAAAYNPNAAVLQVLLEAGADVHGPTYDGWTALMAAARDAEDPVVVRKLLAAGADVEARNKWGTTALMVAAGNHWTPAIVDLLLAAGARLETRNHWGRTALHSARGNPAATRMLLAAGAALEARDNAGSTPLIAAAGDYYGADVVPLLVAAGADPRVRDAQGATALMHAAGNGNNVEVLELLVEAGIELDAKDDMGRSALMWGATFSANPKVVGTLLDLGADAALANHAGETAWDLIQSNEALQGTSAYRRLRGVSGMRHGGSQRE